MPNQSKAKHWVFTLNNYTDDEEVFIQNQEDNDLVVYLGYGKEVGDNGTPHLQGMISLRSRKRLSQVKTLLSDRVHLEVMRGTLQESLDYCSKDGDFWSCGELPGGQGSRSDLESLKNDIDNGKRLRDVADDHFGTFLKYHKGIKLYYGLKATPINWQTLVIVYWGRTGTGKTRAVHDNATDLYVHPGGPWFDGYCGQLQVLFDDFGGSEFKLTYLLKLLDRYPMSVPVKGGFVNWCPREIYLTSNLDPIVWYPNAHQEHQNALKRRFSNCVHFMMR
jgi:hypothetical protein